MQQAARNFKILRTAAAAAGGALLLALSATLGRGAAPTSRQVLLLQVLMPAKQRVGSSRHLPTPKPAYSFSRIPRLRCQLTPYSPGYINSVQALLLLAGAAVCAAAWRKASDFVEEFYYLPYVHQDRP